MGMEWFAAICGILQKENPIKMHWQNHLICLQYGEQNCGVSYRTRKQKLTGMNTNMNNLIQKTITETKSKHSVKFNSALLPVSWFALSQCVSY